MITLTVRKELLQRAADWLVPQPKPEAKLIKFKVFRSNDKDVYALGSVEPGNPKQALVGFRYLDTSVRSETKDVPDPSRLGLDDISPTSPFDAPHGVNFGLVTGIQLLRGGNEKLGTALINKSLDAEAGHPRSPFRSPAGEDPVLMLARSCLAAALNEITSSKPDFPKIKQRVVRLLADQPKLKSEATHGVLGSLEASVAHKPPADGTNERIVEEYLLGGGTQGALCWPGAFTPAERAIILKGFKAVPALLKERHSIRFTNHLMQGFNNFVSYPMSAGQVVDAYLQRLANNEFEPNWLDRQKGFVADDDAVMAWWKSASALGEEAYVQKNTVVLDKDGNASLNYELLLLARERYPALLPDFYRTILKSSLPSAPVMEAIIESKVVPPEEVIQLLEAGIATNSEAHRNSALGNLRNLDTAIADKYLLRLLKDCPKSAKEDYWTDQDANLGSFVAKSRSPEVWQAFHLLLDRADLGMRMELIDDIFPPRDAPHAILDSFQEIFARFGDDKSIRDTAASEKFSGPGAGFPYDKIEMRDFIHEHWAAWLKLELQPPEEGAKADEWRAYRDSVNLALQSSERNNRLRKKDN